MVAFEAPTSLHSALDPVGTCAPLSSETVSLTSPALSPGFNSIICLQDLGGKVEFCGVDTPVTKAMMENQMDVLAALHGRFYKSKEKEVQAIVTWRQVSGLNF